MTRPRALFVSELEGVFGGAERYLELLGPALRERGVEASIALFGVRSREEQEFGERLRAAFSDGILRRRSATARGVRKAIVAVQPDLLHWNMFHPFTYRGGLLAALPWGRPSVLTDHLPMLRGAPHYELIRRLANPRYAAIITVSESGAEAARQHWGRLPDVFVIRNGVQLGETRRRTAPQRPARLLFLGRLDGQKNPLFALEVLAALRRRGREATLRFVGAGDLRPALRHEVQSRRLSEHVELVGFASDTDTHLLQADLLLTPAGFEGLPLAPMEALSGGLPVLASDIPPHRELSALSGGMRLLPVGDAAAWAEEAVGMLDDLERLSDAALASRESFSVAAMADGTLSVYERVLARPESGRSRTFHLDR